MNESWIGVLFGMLNLFALSIVFLPLTMKTEGERKEIEYYGSRIVVEEEGLSLQRDTIVTIKNIEKK